jgi:hypothetical protein
MIYKIEKAVQFAIDVANDDNHGYSQQRRKITGDIKLVGDSDCSALVIDSLKFAGFDTGSASYTGNMLNALLSSGFIDVKKSVDCTTGNGLIRGDILLKVPTIKNNGHTAFYIGNNCIVQAQADFDGKIGDSSGKEIYIRSYYNSGWSNVLRYPELEIDVQTELVRIGHNIAIDGKIGVKSKEAINWERQCAGLPAGGADEELLNYLKSCPSR